MWVHAILRIIGNIADVGISIWAVVVLDCQGILISRNVLESSQNTLAR